MRRVALLVVCLIVFFEVTQTSAQLQQPRITRVNLWARLSSGAPALPFDLYVLGAGLAELSINYLTGASFELDVRVSGGNWAGVSFRDSRGMIYDVPLGQ